MAGARTVWTVCALLVSLVGVTAPVPASGRQPPDREQTIRELQALAWQKAPRERSRAARSLVRAVAVARSFR